MHIGSYQLASPLIVAPMAGVSDQPFRNLCLRYGAGLAVSEMVLANPDVWNTDKSRKRMAHEDDHGIRAVQIVGSEPELMAQTAQANVVQGADLIDINMGCPAKKVNRKLAGSALMQYPDTVKAILQSVVDAVEVPVTLKIRTGWDLENRNCVEIAQIAEDCGIQALTVHGRTRACLFKGEAEYDSIRRVKRAISIPVIANGDITSVEKAQRVLDETQADAIMIGRGAQGRPWFFQEVRHYLETGQFLASPQLEEQIAVMKEHVSALHQYYGEYKGIRFARKHVSWYLQHHPESASLRKQFNTLEEPQAQLNLLDACFDLIA